MKFNKILYIVIATLLLQSNGVFSQTSSNDDPQLLVIREGSVNPSMVADYELSLADFKSYLESKNFKDFSFYTHFQDDYTFRHVSPISDLNSLKKYALSELSKQFNDPEFDLIVDDMNASLINSGNFIVKYLPELSYVSKTETDEWNESSRFRRWTYFYFLPGSEADVEKTLASWKDLYKSKGVKMGFKVFTNFVGEEGPLYILTTWADNPLDYQTELEETLKLLGNEGAGLMQALLNNVYKTKTVEGWYLPQYSYELDK